MKDKTNKIFVVLVSILLLASSLLANNTNYYYKYLQFAGYGLIIIYLAIRIIKKEPVKIIKNKLDLFVIGLVVSTIIPVMTDKYVSLYGSIQTILQYTYVLSLYILIREITQDTKGLGKLITNILIISAIILIVVGIDGITLKLSQELIETLKISDFDNEDTRLIATFGYPNAIAAYIASIVFLTINEYLNHDKKSIKALYKTITFILTVGVILTYSKGVFIGLPLAIIAYIILLKDKKNKIEVIQNTIITLIMSLMYINAFEHFFPLYQDLLICILFGIMIVVNYVINILVEFINTYTANIDFKKIAISGVSIFLGFAIYIAVGLNVYDKYEVFIEEIPADYKIKVINNIKRKH